MKNKFVLFLLCIPAFAIGMYDDVGICPEYTLGQMVKEYCADNDITEHEWRNNVYIRGAFWAWIKSKSALFSFTRAMQK